MNLDLDDDIKLVVVEGMPQEDLVCLEQERAVMQAKRWMVGRKSGKVDRVPSVPL